MADKPQYISFRNFDELNTTPPSSKTKKWYRLGFSWFHRKSAKRSSNDSNSASSSASELGYNFNTSKKNSQNLSEQRSRNDSDGMFYLDNTARTRAPLPNIIEVTPPTRRASLSTSTPLMSETPLSSRPPSIISFRGDYPDASESTPTGFYQRPQTPVFGQQQKMRKRTGTLFREQDPSTDDLLLKTTDRETFGFSSLGKSSSMRSMFQRKDSSVDRDFWMKDETAKYCFKCQQQFTAFRRKHHCRLCGQIFCYNCASRIVSGEPFRKNHDIRICDICYKNNMYGGGMYIQTDRAFRTDDLLLQRRQVPFHRHSRSAVSVSNHTTNHTLAVPASETKSFKTPDSARSLDIFREILTGARAKYRMQQSPTLNRYRPISHVDKISAFRDSAALIADKDDQSQCAFMSNDFGPQHEGNSRPNLAKELSQIHMRCYGGDCCSDTPNYPNPLRGINPPFSFDLQIRSDLGILDEMNGIGRQRVDIDIRNLSLDHFSLDQLQRLTKELLSEAEIPLERGWGPILLRMAVRAAQQVRPDTRGNDSIDLRQYVRIKRIPGGVPGDSQYISGIVFTKDLAYRQMHHIHHSPRIMIITFPLTYEQIGNRYVSFDAAIPQVEEYIAKLVDRIIKFQPTVLLVEKTVCRSALKRLTDNGIVVAYNIKRNVLLAISRSTNANIITSVDKFSMNPQLGFCESMWVECIEDPSLPEGQKSFMFLDGCMEESGVTLVLRGESFDRLESIKRIADLLVIFAYSLRLENSLLLCEHAMSSPPRIPCIIQPSGSKKDQKRVAGQANSLAQASADSWVPHTDSKASRALQKYQIPLSSSLCVYIPPPYVLTQMKIHEDAIRELNSRYQNSQFIQKASSASLNIYNSKAAAPTHITGVDFLLSRQGPAASEFRARLAYESELSRHIPYIQEGEAFIDANPDFVSIGDYQNITISYIVTCRELNDEMCLPIHMHTIEFYSKSDVTLGQYLEHMCFDLNYDCPSNTPCGYPVYQHRRSYIHETGRLDVTMSEHPCPIPTMSEVLLMWGVCKKCGAKTPISPMTEDTWRYSFGKYMEIMFYSNETRPRGSLCPHDIHMDYVRWFALHNMAVQFTFTRVTPVEIKAPSMFIYHNFEVNTRLKKKEANELRDKLKRYYESLISRLRSFPIDYVDIVRKVDCQQDLDEMIGRATTELEYLNQIIGQTMENSHQTDILALYVVYEQIQNKVVQWGLKIRKLIQKFIHIELSQRLNATKPSGSLVGSSGLSAATSAIGKLSRNASVDNFSLAEKHHNGDENSQDFIKHLNIDINPEQAALRAQLAQSLSTKTNMPSLGMSPSSSQQSLDLKDLILPIEPEKKRIFRRLSLKLLRHQKELAEKYIPNEKQMRKPSRSAEEGGTGPGQLIHPGPTSAYPETKLHSRPEAIGKTRIPLPGTIKTKTSEPDDESASSIYEHVGINSKIPAGATRIPMFKKFPYRPYGQKLAADQASDKAPNKNTPATGSRTMERKESRSHIPTLKTMDQNRADDRSKKKPFNTSGFMNLAKKLGSIDDISRSTLPFGNVPRSMALLLPTAQYLASHPKRPSLSQVNLFQTRPGNSREGNIGHHHHRHHQQQQQQHSTGTNPGKLSSSSVPTSRYASNTLPRNQQSLPPSRLASKSATYSKGSNISPLKYVKNLVPSKSGSMSKSTPQPKQQQQQQPSHGIPHSRIGLAPQSRLGLGLNWARNIGRLPSYSKKTSSNQNSHKNNQPKPHDEVQANKVLLRKDASSSIDSHIGNEENSERGRRSSISSSSSSDNTSRSNSCSSSEDSISIDSDELSSISDNDSRKLSAADWVNFVDNTGLLSMVTGNEPQDLEDGNINSHTFSELSPRLEIANMQSPDSATKRRRYTRRKYNESDEEKDHDNSDEPLPPDLHFDDGVGESDTETAHSPVKENHPDNDTTNTKKNKDLDPENAKTLEYPPKRQKSRAAFKVRPFRGNSISISHNPNSTDDNYGIGPQTENVRTTWKALSEIFQTPANKKFVEVATDIDYPFLNTDHIMPGSPIIVRETELSSIVSFTLSASHYTTALNELGAKHNLSLSDIDSVKNMSESQIRELELENALCNNSTDHLKFQFNDGPTDFTCRVFFPVQFDAMRKCCGCSTSFVESLSRCVPWDASGGKSGSTFLKTLDDRYVIKQISKAEMDAFLKFAPYYFEHIHRTYRGEILTMLAKILGFYRIAYRNAGSGQSVKMNVIIQENLFYQGKITKIFDLKGSLRNRLVSEDKSDAVWQDENFVKYIRDNPIYLRENVKEHLHDAIWNDTLFLSKMDVMDYSLLIGIDEEKKEIYAGIVDFIRTFTWDKKLESWVKEAGFLGGGGKVPTIISPKQYKNRFREAMENYFVVVPGKFDFEEMEYGDM
ncbi:Mitochondrial distribution and morphology protein 12 [Mycoemilia scoparia]|uniref:1-phosphatidylinositol-3-phosphate 5-kinase n=1 Tax=Mycoemilia scoparia TaxID=417184 RepID=A0A9W8A2Q4_9FUNG|nr:Mitochondrial distribution and morphology protein 12 [Mycoemilia scoparia]